MKHCSSPIARLMTLVLAVVMLFGVMTVGVNAASLSNVKHYDTYTCLGDSIAAGFGPDNLDYDGSKDGGDLSQLKDADAISEYARPAVAWAAGSGIVAGFPDGSFQPKGSATRAQMAAIIARFDRMEK